MVFLAKVLARMTSWLKERCELRAQVDALTEAMTAKEYAQQIERFHTLDGLKDGFCPCCGAAVNLVDNGHGHGVKIESRWG